MTFISCLNSFAPFYENFNEFFGEEDITSCDMPGGVKTGS